MENRSGVKPEDDLEIAAIGSLYRGPWDKKYWSSSRGKDRYPYPIGYHAIRTHAGSTYKMEVREGLKGPLFVVTSAEGESCHGQTADIAWEAFHKKNGPRVKNWNGKRFSSKIDGTELFGLRNPFVQRLLRELVADVSGSAQRNTLSPNFGRGAFLLDSEMQSQNLQPYPDLISYLGKNQSTRKRRSKSKGPHKEIGKESRTKRLHSLSLSDPKVNSPEQAGKGCPDAEDDNTLHSQEKYKPSKDDEPLESEEKKNPGQRLVPSGLLMMGRVNASLQARGRLPEELEHCDCSCGKHSIVNQKSKLIGSENPRLLACMGCELHYTDKMLLDRAPNARVEQGHFLIAATQDRNGQNSAFSRGSGACLSGTLDTLKDNIMDTIENDLYTRKTELANTSLEASADSPSFVTSKCTMDVSIHERQQCNTSCMSSAPQEMLCPATDMADEVISKVHIKDSLPDGPSSGSSNASFERIDLDSAGQELAKSMMTFLLPRAVPLLRKTYERRRSRCQNDESKHSPSVSFLKRKHGSQNDESDHPTDAISQDNIETRTSVQRSDENIEEEMNCTRALLENHSLFEITTICPASGCLNDDPVMETEASSYARCIIPDSYDDQQCLYHDATRKLLPPSADGNKDPHSDETRSKVDPTSNNEEGDSFCCHVRNDGVRLMDLAGKEESSLLDSSLACVMSHKQRSDEQKIENLCLHGDCSMLHPDPCAITACLGDTAVEPTSVMRGMSLCLSSENLSECDSFKCDRVERYEQDPPSCSYYTGNLDNRVISASLDNSLQNYSPQDLVDSSVSVFTDNINANANANSCSAGAPIPMTLDKRLVLSDKENSSEVYQPNVVHEEAMPGQLVHYSSACSVPLSESIVCRKNNNAVETFEHGFPESISAKLDLKILNEVQLDEQPQFSVAKGNIPSHYRDLLVATPVASQDQDITETANQETNSIKWHGFSFSSLKKDLTNDLHKFHAPLGSIPQFADGKGGTSCKSKTDEAEAIDSSDTKLSMKFTCNKDQEYLCQPQLCQVNHLYSPSTETKSREELRGPMDLVGCYFHPKPVLSILLNSKDDYLKICIICGLLEGNDRNLFMYMVPVQEQRRNCPSFLGYVSLVFPRPKGSSINKVSVETSGLQFTPDGQSLVFLNSIKAPHCREQRVNCLCSDCMSDCHEENAIKVVHVEFGYISSLVKLVAAEGISSILVCEPNYLVAVEDNARLHVWIMDITWSAKLEEFILPGCDHLLPSIVAIKGLPKCGSLIIGHNGIGGFGLWDISKRVLLANFSSPGYTVCQILPVGLFSRQNWLSFAISLRTEDCIKEAMQSKSWLPEHVGDISLLGEDTAVWMLVSTASDSVAEYDRGLKEGNPSPVGYWRHALLAKDMVIMGSVLDDRATAVSALADNGVIGTCDGLVYMWELSTGKYLADLYSFKGGSVSCIEVDAKSGTLAVASDEGQLLVYAQRGGQCRGP